jgi:hypothetical protein
MALIMAMVGASGSSAIVAGRLLQSAHFIDPVPVAQILPLQNQ